MLSPLYRHLREGKSNRLHDELEDSLKNGDLTYTGAVKIYSDDNNISHAVP